MFPDRLKYNNLMYASNVLAYVIATPEYDFRTVGARTQQHLQNFRAVEKVYLSRYYELLAGIVRLLKQYSDLEEACVASGAYERDRQKVLKHLYDGLVEFESQKDLMSLIDGMRTAQP
jgi:hypothetical protein